MKDEKTLKRELWIYRALFLVTFLAMTVVGLKDLPFFGAKPDAEETSSKSSPLDLPYYMRVKEVTSPLAYSGLVALMDPGVTLSINFDKKTWTLHNLHKFDANGDILLDQGKFGLCGELAAYTYRKIHPLFGDDYLILFVRAAEAGFFLRPLSSHTVLAIIDKNTKERFFLDPSFGRYGREADFSEYMFFEVVPPEIHLNGLKPDVVFGVDSGTPIFIREKFILYLTVESVEGRFDKDNFILSITANKKHEFSGRYVYALKVLDGKPRRFRNDALLKRFLSQEEAGSLLNRLDQWFVQYEQESPVPEEKM